MEELSELRDQNCMLKKKVQVLENLKQEQPGRPVDVQKDRFSHARATQYPLHREMPRPDSKFACRSLSIVSSIASIASLTDSPEIAIRNLTGIDISSGSNSCMLK